LDNQIKSITNDIDDQNKINSDILININNLKKSIKMTDLNNNDVNKEILNTINKIEVLKDKIKENELILSKVQIDYDKSKEEYNTIEDNINEFNNNKVNFEKEINGLNNNKENYIVKINQSEHMKQ